jgi:UDPglucose 6-dehydrogenase
MEQRTSIIGLGKLGACMAAAMAHRGARVIGVDVNSRFVDALNRGEAPVVEPQLAEMIAANRARLRATTSVDEAVRDTDITFIIVPTPSDETGGFSIRYVAQVAREVGRALRHKSGYHLVVLTSTVLPGSTEHGLLPILEHESGKQCGRDFGLCYNPEFIALGSVIRDLLRPDVVLVGEHDERAGATLEKFYSSFTENHAAVMRMNIVNAELTKISVNTYITMKITFANMLAAICEELPGADVDAVSAAIGSDSRIGTKYLKGGLGYGGPCFPRDNKALSFMAQTLGAPALLAEATDRMNQVLLERQIERVKALLRPGVTVGVLGLAYKPQTGVVEESQGLMLAASLVESGNCVAVYDPLAMENARAVLKDSAQYYASARECIHNSEAVIITTPLPEFRDLTAEDFPVREQRTLVLDCWRLLGDKLRDCAWIEYVPLGIGRSDVEVARALARAAAESAIQPATPVSPQRAKGRGAGSRA